MFEEMMERAKMEAEAYYTTLFDTLNDKAKQLSSSNEQLISQIDYLKGLLKQHNIQFD